MPSQRPAARYAPARHVVGAVLAAVLLVAVSACGSGSSDTPSVATTTPQTPLPAPTGSARPAGSVVAAPASSHLVLDSTGKRLAVLGADRRSVVVYSTAIPTAPVATRTIPLPEAVSAIGAVAGDDLVAVAPSTLVDVDLATGVASRHDVAVGEPLSVARLSNGSVLIGTADGKIVEVGADRRVLRTVDGLVRVDELAVAVSDGRSDQVVALDRAQSSVTSVDMSDGSLGEALRSGDGATNLVVDHYGRFLTTDTRGGEFLGFDGDPLLTKFRYPVAQGPYAVGYDDVRNLAWVATTGTNEAIAFDLASGIPIEKRRVATVGQADALVVDSATGMVYLLSARGDGLQAVSG
ncbi:YncE family protein [Williamsia sp. M5A3_1d]